MGQITSGLRSLLSVPALYNFLQGIVGAAKFRREFVATYVRATAGNLVLDIGCGTAKILEDLPRVQYYGFDVSEEYVRAARGKYGARGCFTCGIVKSATLAGLPQFDLALAVNVLHHLDDSDAAELFALARSALKPGGRLVTSDACYVEGQSAAAKVIISMDRGQNVRNRLGYETLARSTFADVKGYIRHDLLRTPYTHIILECSG